jgi:hypothetical protein
VPWPCLTLAPSVCGPPPTRHHSLIWALLALQRTTAPWGSKQQSRMQQLLEPSPPGNSYAPTLQRICSCPPGSHDHSNTCTCDGVAGLLLHRVPGAQVYHQVWLWRPAPCCPGAGAAPHTRGTAAGQPPSPAITCKQLLLRCCAAGRTHIITKPCGQPSRRAQQVNWDALPGGPRRCSQEGLPSCRDTQQQPSPPLPHTHPHMTPSRT